MNDVVSQEQALGDLTRGQSGHAACQASFPFQNTTKRITLKLALSQGEAHKLISGPGDTIASIRNEFNSLRLRIWDSVSPSGSRYCAVTGESAVCWAGLVKILEVLQHTSFTPTGIGTSDGCAYVPHGAAFATFTVLKLNSKETGSLIGRAGLTISGIRAQLPSGASVLVQKDSLEMDAAFRTSVVIRSNPQDRLDIVKKIVATAMTDEHQATRLVDTAIASSTGGSTWASAASAQSVHSEHASSDPAHSLLTQPHDGTVEPGSSCTVAVPVSCIGHVIGKGGARVNRIRQQSRASVKIAQVPVGEIRMATISGSPAAQAEASLLIQAAIQEAFMLSASAAQAASAVQCSSSHEHPRYAVRNR